MSRVSLGTKTYAHNTFSPGPIIIGNIGDTNLCGKSKTPVVELGILFALWDADNRRFETEGAACGRKGLNNNNAGRWGGAIDRRASR